MTRKQSDAILSACLLTFLGTIILSIIVGIFTLSNIEEDLLNQLQECKIENSKLREANKSEIFEILVENE